MIDTTTITSVDSGKSYELYLHNNKAVGCTCEFRLHHPFTACKHMKTANTPRVEVAPLVPEYSCELCGRRVGRAYMVCSKCGGV